MTVWALVGGGVAVAQALGAGLMLSGREVAALNVGLAVGILVTPDLDLNGWTRDERRWLRIPLIGWAIALLFWVWWFPYSHLVRHRSVWSHGWLIGTLGRALYILGILYLLHLLFGWNYAWGLPLLLQPNLVLAAFTGWLLQDTLHIVLDQLLRNE